MVYNLSQRNSTIGFCFCVIYLIIAVPWNILICIQCAHLILKRFKRSYQKSVHFRSPAFTGIFNMFVIGGSLSMPQYSCAHAVQFEGRFAIEQTTDSVSHVLQKLHSFLFPYICCSLSYLTYPDSLLGVCPDGCRV